MSDRTPDQVSTDGLLVSSETSVLRLRAAPIDPPTAMLYVPAMFKVLPELKGIGLAAPQIGYGWQLAVIEHDEQRFVLINPTFQPLGKPRDRVADVEGCLSLPGRRFEVHRFPAITVHSQMPTGPVTFTARGWLARVFQHELDHLDGICIDQSGTEVFDEAVAS